MPEPISVDDFLSALHSTDAFQTGDRTAAKAATDAIRSALESAGDHLDRYHALCARIGAYPSPEYRRLLIVARDEYDRRLLAATIASIYQALVRSAADAWTTWVSELADTLLAGHYRRCLRLCDEAFPFDAAHLQIVGQLRQGLEFVRQTRWEEAYDALVLLSEQSSLSPLARAHVLTTLGDVDLWRFDDSALARTRYDDAVKLAPGDGQVLSYQGDWLQNDKRFDEAAKYYEESIRLSPDGPCGYVGMGDRFERDTTLGEDRFKEAESWFRKAIAQAGGETLGYSRLISLLARPETLPQREPEVVALTQSLIDVDPDSTYDASLDVGGYYLNAKRFADARVWFEKAVNYQEHWPVAYVSLSNLCAEEGRESEAESYRRKALEIDPEYAGGFIAMGLFLEERNRWRDALQVYARFPQRPAQWIAYGRACLARMHAKLGEYQDAERVLFAQLSLTPDDGHVRAALEAMASDYYERKDKAAALRVYGEMRRILGDAYTASYHTHRGAMFAFLDEPDQAVIEYEKAVKAAPDGADRHRTLSAAYRTVKDWGGAERESARAYELDKDEAARAQDIATIANLRGNDSYGRGEYRAAIEQYQQAVAAVPREPVYYSNLASAWKQLREPGRRLQAIGEATHAYESALELNPQGPYRDAIDRLSRRQALVQAYGERALEHSYVVSPIAIEVATDLVPHVTGSATGGLSADLLADINSMRASLAAKFGLAIPGLRFRGNTGAFVPGTYVVMIYDVPVATGRLEISQQFCPDAEGVGRLGTKATPAQDPVTGAPGAWVDGADAAAVAAKGLELWPITHYIVRHVEAILRRNLDQFVGHQEVAVLLDRTATPPATEIRQSSGMMTGLTKLCRALLAEGVPIQPFDALSAAFKDLSASGLTPRRVVERVRNLEGFREHLPGNDGRVCTALGPAFEDAVRQSMYSKNGRAVLAMEPTQCQNALSTIKNLMDGQAATLVVDDQELRPFVRKVVELELPDLAVLSRAELREGATVTPGSPIEIAAVRTSSSTEFRVPHAAGASDELPPSAATWADMEIAVLTSRELAKAPINGQDPTMPEILATMHESLFSELGIMLPDVTLDVDATLPADHFRIRLNGVDLPSIRGLSAHEFLADDTVVQLRLLGMWGGQAVNPSNGFACAIVDEEHDESATCRRAGLMTWGTRGYIGLALTAAIRAAADRFQSDGVTQACLDSLGEDFPDLVRIALERFTVSDISHVLRHLLHESVSIRDLWTILETLLTIDGTTDVDFGRFVVFTANTDGLCPATAEAVADLKPAQLADFVRAHGLKRPISFSYAGSSGTLAVYLLDPDLEARLADTDVKPLTEQERGQLLADIQSEVSKLSRRNSSTVILTTFGVRRVVRRLIEHDLPRLAVLNYQELSANVTIQPLARISLR